VENAENLAWGPKYRETAYAQRKHSELDLLLEEREIFDWEVNETNYDIQIEVHNCRV